MNNVNNVNINNNCTTKSKNLENQYKKHVYIIFLINQHIFLAYGNFKIHIIPFMPANVR